ncbi:MmcQ/YjbR family DNA-binding protein [Pseudonocardiaceae bacterium YIM PH 21723]|nr:MmcQ/YjbR family DNA-binding protein [Pseudonocardiaceae bacterium YIM PH 21723]
MATWDDVRRLALDLPEVTERAGRTPQWRVRDKMFAWDRPLRGTDLAELGDRAPDGEILGLRVADLHAKEALIASDPGVYFTIPHFDGYASVLVLLDRIDVQELREALTDAWLVRAPKRLAAEFLAE